MTPSTTYIAVSQVDTYGDTIIQWEHGPIVKTYE